MVLSGNRDHLSGWEEVVTGGCVQLLSGVIKLAREMPGGYLGTVSG